MRALKADPIVEGSSFIEHRARRSTLHTLASFQYMYEDEEVELVSAAGVDFFSTITAASPPADAVVATKESVRSRAEHKVRELIILYSWSGFVFTPTR